MRISYTIVVSFVLFLNKELTYVVTTINNRQRSRRPSAEDRHHRRFELLKDFSKFFIMQRTELVGLTQIELIAIAMKVEERTSTLISWICRDEHSRQLHVQLPTQNSHLKYG